MGISDYIYLRSALALESATQQKRKKKEKKTNVQCKYGPKKWYQQTETDKTNSSPLIRVSAGTLYIQGFIFISNMFCVIPRDTNKEQKNFLEKQKANSSKISSAMWTKHKVNPQKKGQAKTKTTYALIKCDLAKQRNLLRSSDKERNHRNKSWLMESNDHSACSEGTDNSWTHVRVDPQLADENTFLHMPLIENHGNIYVICRIHIFI